MVLGKTITLVADEVRESRRSALMWGGGIGFTVGGHVLASRRLQAVCACAEEGR